MRASRPAAALIAAAAVSLSLAACAESTSGDDTAGGEVQADTPEASAEFPVTITHALGETVIEEQPERIATVGWSNQEAVLALGAVPVIMEKATWGDDDGDGVLPWVEDKLTEMGAETPAMYDGTDGVDFEAISDADPDVILAAYSGLSEDDYATLSQIAPVVAYPDVPWGTTWQETITLNGTAMGLQTEAEALVADLEGQIEEAVAGYPDIAGTTALWAWFDVTDLSSVGFYTVQDPRALILTEVGFEQPSVLGTAAQDEFFTSVSAEAVDELSDVDVIVTYGTGEELEVLQADPLLSRIPAVANGAIVFLDDSQPETVTLAASANPSPLNISSMIELYLPVLDEAAAKAK